MTVKEFLDRNPQIESLYVSGERNWSSNPVKGYSLKSREEILNPPVTEVEEPKEVEEIKETKSNKKK